MSTEEVFVGGLAELAPDIVGEPEPREERHLRAVPPRRRRQPRVALWLGSIVTAASLFLLVAFNVFMVQGQFDLNLIAQERAVEQNQYEHNRALVAQRSSPDTIIRKALERGYGFSALTRYLSVPGAASTSSSSADQTITTQQQTNKAAKQALDASP
jgi:hypothetical protein